MSRGIGMILLVFGTGGMGGDMAMAMVNRGAQDWRSFAFMAVMALAGAILSTDRGQA